MSAHHPAHHPAAKQNGISLHKHALNPIPPLPRPSPPALGTCWSSHTPPTTAPSGTAARPRPWPRSAADPACVCRRGSRADARMPLMRVRSHMHDSSTEGAQAQSACCVHLGVGMHAGAVDCRRPGGNHTHGNQTRALGCRRPGRGAGG